ncbi:tetratricopeptide repeat protein [Litoribrevibacter albus]|uniref:Tetratricopeptide repeat protein n=1 Tax=Litoribrevibacter albus TaxID=1473156 RepID=A0AA37SAJ4_9GAMM|nr:hypothetical protein [Litoribrevibacter albus]GLQ31142.1 hypothetical protein GCM10007876_16210 [Litoribrevibacter albus]
MWSILNVNRSSAVRVGRAKGLFFYVKNLFSVLLGSCLVFSSALVSANNELSDEALALAQEWAHIQYEVPKQDKLEQFEQLIDKAHQSLAAHPDQPDLLIWNGIITSVYAGEVGGLSALGKVKEAKAYYEQALKIDERALNGSAYASLATLYYKVPGWPLSFGDSDMAREYFRKALEIAPDSIDSNYLYASYLVEEDGEDSYDLARQYLQRAMASDPRPLRPLADQGRRQEIKHLLDQLKE